MKIKKGDTVLIISGKDRGKRGKVLDVLKGEGKIVVEGINIRKKHVRPKKSGEKGQIIEKPAAFDLSNAKLICPKCGKPTRVGYKVSGEKKFRACKKCEAEI
ncbi:MAG: 50S ribosomal protein L24 [Candidatus Nealsonbacteria bacterium]|nr:50S ribosomal protein L24 [Candidatus Nealsonbacteria bacterium]